MNIPYNPPIINMDAHHLETLAGMTVEFPYIMDRTDVSDFPIPWHWHEELEFIQVDEGEEEIQTNNGRYLAHAGECYFVNTNVMTMKQHSEGAARTLETGHVFHPIFLYGHFGSMLAQQYVLPILQDPTLEVVVMHPDTEAGKRFIRSVHQLTKLQEDLEYHDIRRAFLSRNLLSEGWIALWDETRSNPSVHSRPAAGSSDRIRKMMQYVSTHFAQKVTLQNIADSAYISRRDCIRTFHQCLNKTPIEYLTFVRIENAQQMLLHTDRSITEIASDCGFSDSSYFTKVFRETCGMPPTSFRERYGRTKI